MPVLFTCDKLYTNIHFYLSRKNCVFVNDNAQKQKKLQNHCIGFVHKLLFIDSINPFITFTPSL